MIKLSRRDFSRFTLLAAAGAAVPMSAFAFGGPSGPATIYKKTRRNWRTQNESL